MSVVVFEDAICDLLAPVTTGRLAATITCGSYRLIDYIADFNQPTYGLSREYLEPIQATDCPSLLVLNELELSTTGNTPVKLLLNARVAASESNRQTILRMLQDESPHPQIVRDRDSVAAFLNPPLSLNQVANLGVASLTSWLASHVQKHSSPEYSLKTFMAPHEIVAMNMREIASNLERRISTGQWQQAADGVFLGANAKLGQYVLCETQKGPIVIEEGAQVGPYSLLRGPLYIGRRCKILEHSAIKDMVSLGHTTKIGGEVEASVVEPFTNKQHHGFLGHSYLGSWINLGAGTCNSDLKNTYGTVNMEYPHGKAATGMQFLGCIMGDYSKSAINTGIFTGKVIGVCSMMYGFVTSNVPSFVNYARLFGQIATLPPEVMIASQQRMFARRDVAQRPLDIQLIHDMFRLTQFERDQSLDLV
jgi:UDP-N-acetylglucosamine diphosphorylase / glucose-1-phosphate thymidylyltransferase / UDP-N-acetylgalactosamine diphosphorylase / glucosamine-1-phosphate N-acetyltransferase / galactosamine-1-phosphate N-acetyltransferase